MDKRDDDALLNAYNLVRERLKRNRAESGRLEDALQQTVLNVLKARGRVKDLPAYALRTVYRELRRLARLEWLSEQRETTAERFGLQPDLGSETRPYRRVLALQLLSKLEERDQILVRLYAEEYPGNILARLLDFLRRVPSKGAIACCAAFEKLPRKNRRGWRRLIEQNAVENHG